MTYLSRQAWGDKKSVAGLYGFLREEMRQRSGGPQWAAMAELTPSPWDIIIPNRGLRDLAQKANSEVTKWFRDEWWHTASIVATDFFLGNDMIDVSIEANIKRRKCVAGLISHRRGRRGRRGRRRVPSMPTNPAWKRRDDVSQGPALPNWLTKNARASDSQPYRRNQDSGHLDTQLEGSTVDSACESQPDRKDQGYELSSSLSGWRSQVSELPVTQSEKSAQDSGLTASQPASRPRDSGRASPPAWSTKNCGRASDLPGEKLTGILSVPSS